MEKTLIEEQKCPKCGVTKITYPDSSVLFRTKWSELCPTVNPMTPAAFNTKCCQYARNKENGEPCINNSEEYDSKYDFKIQHARMGLEIKEKLNYPGE